MVEMKIDTHIHSVYSGHAALRPGTIVDFCKKNNIVPALTDHNTTAGWASFSKEAKKAGVPFIPGEEIKVFENGKPCGELLALFLQEEVKKGEMPEVLDALRAQDAVVSAAHPFDFFRKALFFREKRREFAKKLDCIEVFNSRSYMDSFNRKAADFAKKKKMPFTAGTDAHFSIELGNAFMETDADSLDAARKNILKGKCSFKGRLSPRRIHVYTQLAKIKFFRQWFE
ncbi:MAG: PHP domain-containing protein [Candidatus Diapherotrites archaeon]|nr:PHP domain-containing protein [Candidatus Diapherotrites archaeon]